MTIGQKLRSLKLKKKKWSFVFRKKFFINLHKKISLTKGIKKKTIALNNEIINKK